MALGEQVLSAGLAGTALGSLESCSVHGECMFISLRLLHFAFQPSLCVGTHVYKQTS